MVLPPLPRTAAAQGALIERLQRGYTVLAVDPPGYGLSDPLAPAAEAEDDLSPYVTALVRLIDAFALGTVAVVGQGAGAQLAGALAAAHPDRVAACIVDGPLHLDPAAVAEALDGGFPDLTPRRDGGHLLTTWDMAESAYLFAPWQATAVRRRLAFDVPSPDEVHRDFLDYLRAGEAYARAPRAALIAAGRPPSAEPPVPTILLRDPDEVAAYLDRVYRPVASGEARTPDETSPGQSRPQSCYIDLADGQLFAPGLRRRRRAPPSGPARPRRRVAAARHLPRPLCR